MIFHSQLPLYKRGTNDILFKKLQECSGEEELSIMDEIVLVNLRLVAHIVGRFKFSDPHYIEDASGAGYMALLKAVRSFDPDKGVKFATYASRVVENEILMMLRRDKKHKGVDSIHHIIKEDIDGGDLTLEDVIEMDFKEIDSLISSDEVKSVLSVLRDKVTPKQWSIYEFYLMTREQGITHTQIADKFGMSQSYVTRIISKVSAKAREIRNRQCS